MNYTTPAVVSVLELSGRLIDERAFSLKQIPDNS